MTIEKALGQVIRRFRQQRGFSQDALSAASNLDRSYISLVECGKKNPTLISIFSLASGLDVPPQRILTEVEALLAISSTAEGPRLALRTNGQRSIPLPVA